MHEKIKKISEEYFKYARKFRRELHRHPELSEHEVETERRICLELDRLGIDYISGVCGHGVIASVYGRDRSKALGIRADIDALPLKEAAACSFRSETPGVMHACGHDIHTAVLLGSAAVLKRLSDEGLLKYSVKLIFQPAEETIGGARRMIEWGCLENPKLYAVLGLHAAPELEAGRLGFVQGAMYSAMSDLFVTVKGKGSHGAEPQLGVDPLIPACTMVASLEAMIARRMGPFEPAIVTVGRFESGTAPNVIPDETRFEGGVRAMNTASRIRLEGYVRELCESTAQAFGAKAEVRFENSDPALVNDDRLYEILLSEASELFGREGVEAKGEPTMGAEDFAYFSERLPSLFYRLGTRREGDVSPAPIHSELFDPDDCCILSGIESEVCFALRLMEEDFLWK